MKRIEPTVIEIDGNEIPAKVYQERRNNVRVSIGKTAAFLRMPSHFNKKQAKNQIGWFQRWVKAQFDSNEQLKTRFFPKLYVTGDKIQVGERSYELIIDYEDRSTSTANLKNGFIHLKMNKTLSKLQLNKGIKTLLSRVIGKDFKAAITQRVLELNKQYFQKDIKSVNLKHNTSNWGSCSTKKNINLSTRLLFSPPDVIDYVIIHELTHLIEMNHSPKFWKIVHSVMPDYKQKEQWLKDNGKYCNF